MSESFQVGTAGSWKVIMLDGHGKRTLETGCDRARLWADHSEVDEGTNLIYLEGNVRLALGEKFFSGRDATVLTDLGTVVLQP